MGIEIRVGQFKGHPTLSIFKFNPDTGREYNVLTFGLAKAKILVEYHEEIKAFIAAAEQAGLCSEEADNG